MESLIRKKGYYKDGKLLTGFTLIEMIVSIFILSVALVGIFSAFYVVTILTSSSSDRLTATYLAQEGMEIVRNMRDTNWLNMDANSSPGATWIDGFKAGECSSTGCEADYETGTTNQNYPMAPWAGKYLYIDSNYFYGYNPNHATPTKFKRKIIISCLDSFGNIDSYCLSTDYVIKVTVQVSWDEKATISHSYSSADDGITNCSKKGYDNCVVAEDTLYDWYNYANH